MALAFYEVEGPGNSRHFPVLPSFPPDVSGAFTFSRGLDVFGRATGWLTVSFAALRAAGTAISVDAHEYDVAFRAA